MLRQTLVIAGIVTLAAQPVAARGAALASERRILQTTADYDGNGVIDAQTVLFYDANGFIERADYTYIGDGTPDLLNLADDDALFEQQFYTFDPDGHLVRVLTDRGFESFDYELTYVAGVATGGSNTLRDGSGNVLSVATWTLNYVDDRIASVDQFSNGTPDFTLGIDYGGNGLVRRTGFVSGGFDTETTIQWRSDGQPAGLVQRSVIQGIPDEQGGSATLQYDSAGRRIHEQWTSGAFSGSLYADVATRGYSLTRVFDTDGLLLREEWDLDSDGNLDAIEEFVWEEAPCKTGYVWSTQRLPNFTAEPGRPFVPGDGAFIVDVCGLDEGIGEAPGAVGGLRVAGLDAAGRVVLEVDATCGTTDYSVVYGALSAVSSYGYAGARCSFDPDSDSADVGAGSAFFLVVGNDGATAEGSYGRSSAQSERPASSVCGFTQDLAESCN